MMGREKRSKECKSKRKHQGKKTLCCMEQPPSQRQKEQKPGKRREKGENVVYFFALCPGDSLPSFISFFFPPSLSLASSNPFLSLFSTSFPDSCPSFLCLHPGGPPSFCFISSLFHFHSGVSSSCSSFHFSVFSLASSFHAPCSYLLPHSGGIFMLQQHDWLLCFP